MIARIAEIYRLLKRKLITPSFIKIDGELFLHTVNDAFSKAELSKEIADNPALDSMVNEPCDKSFFIDVVEYTLYRLALGLEFEETEDCDPDGLVIGRKKKKLAPSLPAIMEILKAEKPQKYGKDATGSVSVADWITGVLEAEARVNPESRAAE